MKITLISDTHSHHSVLKDHLPGGDLIIHAGDMSSLGYTHEIERFCAWYESLNYTHKVFIAGNHDWGFQNKTGFALKTVKSHHITYLKDSFHKVNNIKIYGSPWQPAFCDWAFNLPRNGPRLQEKWNKIHEDTNILITHGPVYGIVDLVTGRTDHLGCELLRERIEVLKPKIHVCGHIHTGRGYYFNGYTHFFNASVLNERYCYAHKPWNIEWDPDTNKIEFLE